MPKLKNFLALAAFVYIVYIISTFVPTENTHEFVTHRFQSSGIKRKFTKTTNNSTKVVIGAVFCRTGAIKRNKYYDQTIVMIKSVLISAKLFNISTVEIHLFLEYLKDGEYFWDDIQKIRFPDNPQNPEIILQGHLAVSTVPKRYRDQMIYHPRYRCGYVRFFYPSALPNVDSIIHLDSDIIVTGNIMQHWELLGQMDDKQLISIGYNRQPENNKYLSLDKDTFKGAPFVPPKGVNSGVIVMNLTRMREYKLEEKFVEVYEEYLNKVELHDQKVINILLYYNPELLLIMPCHLHFLGTDCESGFFCKSAFGDPDGIHLIHGNANRFLKGKIFHPVFKFYSEFNVSDPRSNFIRDLMEPIQQAYFDFFQRHNKCYGNVNKVIFKRFLN